MSCKFVHKSRGGREGERKTNEEKNVTQQKLQEEQEGVDEKGKTEKGQRTKEMEERIIERLTGVIEQSLGQQWNFWKAQNHVYVPGV